MRIYVAFDQSVNNQRFVIKKSNVQNTLYSYIYRRKETSNDQTKKKRRKRKNS